MRWNYSVEAQKAKGGWSHGVIWAVRREEFRVFCRYMNIMEGPVVRIRRIMEEVEPDLYWPEDCND